MKRLTTTMAVFLAAMVVALSGAAMAADEPASGKAADSVKGAITFQRKYDKPVGGDYFVYLPRDYGRQNVKWPVVLFLHGAGGSATGWGLPKLAAEGKQFPFILVSPQSSSWSGWWDNDQLGGLLDEVAEKYAVDPDRICVTGISMGGFGTWALAAAFPERFAAVVPIAGACKTDQAASLAHLAIWVFHGGKDKAVGIDADQAMVKALKEHGSNVRFTVYPEAGHDAWTQAYNTPELFDWLLKQRRGVPSAPVKDAPDSQPATLPAAPAGDAPAAAKSVPQAMKYRRTVTKSVGGDYLVYLPPEYGRPNVKWPMVFFLHHSGRAEGHMLGLPELVAAGKQFSFIVVAPQCPPGQWWDNDELGGLLDEVGEKYAVDPNRAYLMGISEGSSAGWGLATALPERFAAIVPIAGGGLPQPLNWKPAGLARVPIWAFDGAKDPQVSAAEAMVVGLREYGSDVRFTVYPEVGHGAWTKACAAPELYEWLLKQKRPATPPPAAVKVKPKGQPVTLKVAAMKLTNAEVVSQAGASGVVKFQADGAAEGTVRLPPGGYEIEGWLLVSADKPDPDAVTLDVEGRTTALAPRKMQELAASRQTIRFLINEEREVTVKLSNGKPGVLVDRLVIKPLY